MASSATAVGPCRRAGSIAGSLPSGDTSVASACTRCRRAVTRPLLLEWIRPVRDPGSPDATAALDHPLGASVMVIAVTSLPADGMKMPTVGRSAAGLPTSTISK